MASKEMHQYRVILAYLERLSKVELSLKIVK
jgi:hypothetical protein